MPVAVVALTLALLVQDPPVVIDDVLVEGRRDAARAYVAATVRPRRAGQVVEQIARWETPVCVRVIGPRRNAAARMEADIRAVMDRLDVPVAGARCVPNAVVAVTDQPAAFAGKVIARHRMRLFANSTPELAVFGRPAGAVRWHHRVSAAGGVVQGVAGVAQGMLNTSVGGQGGGGGGRSLMDSGLPMIRMPNARLDFSTSAGIDRAIVVIDTAASAAVPREALIDYLAYVVATGPVQDGTPPPPGILSLFDDAGVADDAATLTPADEAFVRALYASDAYKPAAMQGTEIVNRMNASPTP